MGRPGRKRRHTNNKGRRKILNGTHEHALKHVARRLGVPYGKKEKP